MGNCQNYGPFLGPYYNTGPNLGDPKGTIILTIPHIGFGVVGLLRGLQGVEGIQKAFSYPLFILTGFSSKNKLGCADAFITVIVSHDLVHPETRVNCLLTTIT